MPAYSPHPAHGLSGPHHTPPPRYPRICDLVVYHNAHYRGMPAEVAALEPLPAVVRVVLDPDDPESRLHMNVFHASPLAVVADAVPYGPGKPGCWGWPPR